MIRWPTSPLRSRSSRHVRVLRQDGDDARRWRDAACSTTCRAWSRPSNSEAAMRVTRRGALLGSAALASLALTRADAAEPVHIAVTKGPGCECCEGWAKHLRANGYTVSVTESDDLDGVKTKLGIPEDLRTCHTGQMGDYLLEGHVPAVAVALSASRKARRHDRPSRAGNAGRIARHGSQGREARRIFGDPVWTGGPESMGALQGRG